MRTRLAALRAEQAELEATLRKLERQQASARSNDRHPALDANEPAVTASSSSAEKVALFRRLSAGRTDIFPARWDNRKTGRSGYSPACANEWAKGVCGKPQIKCGECPHQAFIPVSDEVIDKYLRGGNGRHRAAGDFVAGIYPLLTDETCWFLAADFDKQDWAVDALAMIDTCHVKGVPAALERSRSGNGGHVWIFFAAPISARIARQLGAAIMTETMERRPEIGFGSYDRFFPSQDTMPLGGFGNLIALALQGRARVNRNSVFIDRNLRPYDDQWAFLSSLPRLAPEQASEMVAEAERRGTVLSVRMPVDDEDADEPWRMTPSRRRELRPIDIPLPENVGIVVADQLYVDRTELPPALTARVIRLAAFQNPEFYRSQAMRLPTFGKPRIISCAELHPRHVGLPRGCLDEAVELLRVHGAEAAVEDLRTTGSPFSRKVCFRGTLHDSQVKAFDALAPHDYGVLAAPPRSAKRSWPLRSSLCGRVTRSFSFIAASCSPSGSSGSGHSLTSIPRKSALSEGDAKNLRASSMSR